MQGPSRDETTAFYTAAIAAAAFVDHSGGDRLLDADADAAWRAYGADLPPVVRIDLVLKNLAMLYPAAFAPGPVFQLPGWYDDDPWGVGFERPPRFELEALFRQREPLADAGAALNRVREIWGIAPQAAAPFAERLSPSSQILVAGAKAMVTVALALQARPNHKVRSQVLLVSDTPAARHLLGIASAFGREQGVPRMIRPEPFVEARQAAAKSGAPPATFVVTSSDASPAELACVAALADDWRIKDRFEVQG